MSAAAARKHIAAHADPPAPAALRIRTVTALDLAPLRFFFDTVLRNDYFLRRGQLEDICTDKYHTVYVAELDSVLVGVAIKTRGTCLTNVLVHPAYRGMQVGRALIEASGAISVRAKLDMSTGDPRRFYERLGFHRTGARNAKGNIELMERPASGPRLIHNNATGQTASDPAPRSANRTTRSAAKRRSRSKGSEA